VAESVWDELLFPRDVNANGEEVLRDATIRNEPLQRGKSLLHPEQVRLRTQRLDAIQTEQRRIEDAKRQKDCDRVDNIRHIRSELLKIASNDDLNHNNSLDECELAHFKELKADDLVLFILAHDPRMKSMPPTKHSRMHASRCIQYKGSCCLSMPKHSLQI
jgi:hypothetical protein